MSEPVFAGGGVVLRGGDGGLEVLLVHRPRYDDWSFPKGKSLTGETGPETALREVLEETGVVCDAGPELSPVSYRDALGRDKVVRYWLMRVHSDDGFSPNHEVDETKWVPVHQVPILLSHERDRAVLRDGSRFAEPILLVRHAKAGSREHWKGDDRRRPLSPKGRRQAAGLVDALMGMKVSKILSGPADRCLQTVQPLARSRGLEIEVVQWLDEGTAVAEALGAILATPGPAVLSSHGDVIPGVVLHLSNEGVPIVGPSAWRKGSTWIIERGVGVPSSLRYEPPPRDRDPRT